MLLELPGQPRLADPADADDRDERRPGSRRAVPWIGVLHEAELVVTSDERRLERVRPSFAAPVRHDALRLPEGHQLLLALELVLPAVVVRDGRLRRALRRLSDEHGPGSAADWMRAAVLTMSPATMPCPSAPMVTAASPVRTPARAASSGAPTSIPSADTAATRSSAARTARSASSSVAVGVPHTAMTASPMNFSTVPPYARSACGSVEVAGQEFAHLLGVAALGERREADEVGEEDGDEPPLGRGPDGCWSRRTRPRHRARFRIHRRTSWSAGSRSRSSGRSLRARCRTHRRTSVPPRSRSRRTST